MQPAQRAGLPAWRASSCYSRVDVGGGAAVLQVALKHRGGEVRWWGGVGWWVDGVGVAFAVRFGCGWCWARAGQPPGMQAAGQGAACTGAGRAAGQGIQGRAASKPPMRHRPRARRTLPASCTGSGMRMEEPRSATPKRKVLMSHVSCLPGEGEGRGRGGSVRQRSGRERERQREAQGGACGAAAGPDGCTSLQTRAAAAPRPPPQRWAHPSGAPRCRCRTARCARGGTWTGAQWPPRWPARAGAAAEGAALRGG